MHVSLFSVFQDDWHTRALPKLSGKRDSGKLRLGRSRRQENGEECAFTNFGMEMEGTVALLYQPLNNRKS